jgi:hypothetical protein
MEGEVDPCHWDVVNGGCMVVGRPHPSHPFTEPHPTVYENAQAIRKKTSDGWKSMFVRWRDWLFIPLYERTCVGFWKFPKGSLSFQWSSPEVSNSITINGVVQLKGLACDNDNSSQFHSALPTWFPNFFLFGLCPRLGRQWLLKWAATWSHKFISIYYVCVPTIPSYETWRYEQHSLLS